jgi:hypothetical protein
MRASRLALAFLSALAATAACSGGSAGGNASGGSGGTKNSGGTSAGNTGGVAALAAASGTWNGGSGGGGGEPPDASDPCHNGVNDGTETDVDCGGWCGPCPPGRKCISSSDCGGDCIDGVCCSSLEPGCPGTCMTCVDTGGGCLVIGGSDPDDECAGADTCYGPLCRCFDGQQDFGETGVDCGGNCAPCGGTCSDGVKNNGETDVDCGGASCTGKCATGERCSTDSDCDQAICFKGKCCEPEASSVTCAGMDCGHMSGNCGQMVTCGPDACAFGQWCITGKCLTP